MTNISFTKFVYFMLFILIFIGMVPSSVAQDEEEDEFAETSVLPVPKEGEICFWSCYFCT